MKKSIIVGFSLFLFVLSTYCQEIKVKKSIVSFDNVPTLNISGEVSLFKLCHLLFTNMENDSVVEITNKRYYYKNPFYEDIYYLHVYLPKQKMEMNFYRNGFTSEKQVARFLFIEMGLKIMNNQIDTAGLSKIYQKYNQSQKIANDTLSKINYDKIITEYLQNDPSFFELDYEYLLKETDRNAKDGKITTRYDIYLKKKLKSNDLLIRIGMVKKVDKVVNNVAFTSYDFYKKLQHEVVLADSTKTNMVICAKIYMKGNDVEDIYTFKDCQKGLNFIGDINTNSEKSILDYLVKKRYY
jgi:hypothetical protein